ncbi:MAG TPA: glycoside hydrolase family 3 N-terminal domain-containing protein [Anaerolineaceae bacterium]|nr:glycoside hydrolase family 3 N-terminal domain-containing protein [Anaerolineaceae bacterium]
MDSIEKRLTHIISKMTLDEKLAQLGSYWMFDLQTSGVLDWEKIAHLLRHGIGQVTRIGGASTLDPVGAAQAANRLQKFLVEETRLGIPAILHEECCAGAMLLGGTVFPQMLGLASTFQPELAEEMASTIRKQLLAIGARQALAPVLDVARDPRWGRVEETFGEDSTLTSQFGMAYIRGLQTDNLSAGVMATGKHFIGHSLSQGGLNCAPVHVGMQELYEVCLAPFQAAIRDAGLASIMNAYPEQDGEVVAASRRILTDLLRGQLGFDGVVVSDYEAVMMIHNFHKMAPTLARAASLALNAGIDVELPSTVCYGEPLKAALDQGEISLEMVDTSVRRHLRKKFELGLFENPYVDEGKVLEAFETTEQRVLAREIGRKSMVLLKNDGLLPLPKTIQTLAVIGPNADNTRNQLADYSYAAMRELMEWKRIETSSFYDRRADADAKHEVRVITVLEGIRAAVSGQTQVLYAKGCDALDPDRSGIEAAAEAAKQADVVVLVLGDRSGLTPECTTGETRDSADLKLPGVQEELIQAVLGTGKPVAAVLITGRPYAVTSLVEGANAILEAWLPGEEGGNAIAETLFGDVNPGGKLAITFPRSVGQVPIFYNAKPSGTKSFWYVDYVAEKVTPLYSFGHGLSYTSFEYSDLAIFRQHATVGEQVKIALTVKNSGKYRGDEVVQLYTCDEFASTPRPVKELRGFYRLSLNPGEAKRIYFHLPVDQLAFYDNDLCLVLEPGAIAVMVGSSAEDIRLRGEFEIVGERKMVVRERVFVSPVEVESEATSGTIPEC